MTFEQQRTDSHPTPHFQAITRQLIAFSMAACISINVSAQSFSISVKDAYSNLVSVLTQSPETRPDAADRSKINAAARDLQHSINLDGGARPALVGDATNIVNSLTDGTFSARGSINALQRDAEGNAVLRADWHPPLSGGRTSDAIGTHLNQTSEGDCVGIAVVRAFANTSAGSAILRKAVIRNADGSFSVSLPGDPSSQYRLSAQALDQYGKGDPSAAALVGALFEYFRLNPKSASLPTNKVMEVLAGNEGEHFRLADAHSASPQIAGFLYREAPLIGRRVAMVFGGAPDHHGDWTKGDGHAFAVIQVDTQAGTVTYSNPWDQRVQHTISIADLARQAAGTSADFEIVTFR